MNPIIFSVPGTPEAQGSLKQYCPRSCSGTNNHGQKKCEADRPILTSTNDNLKQWRHLIGWHARKVAPYNPIPKNIPLDVTATFYLPRPESTDREYPTTYPDVDKLTRALFDALTGIIWTDDSQVCRISDTMKVYADDEHSPGIEVKISENLDWRRATEAEAIA